MYDYQLLTEVRTYARTVICGTLPFCLLKNYFHQTYPCKNKNTLIFVKIKRNKVYKGQMVLYAKHTGFTDIFHVSTSSSRTNQNDDLMLSHTYNALSISRTTCLNASKERTNNACDCRTSVFSINRSLLMESLITDFLKGNWALGHICTQF